MTSRHRAEDDPGHDAHWMCGAWSISAYREHFYVHNPIERYAITSGMPLTYNPDGSLDVYVEARSPGSAKESNWLPCSPSGRFNLSARIYQPKAGLLDGRSEDSLVVEAGSYTIPPGDEGDSHRVSGDPPSALRHPRAPISTFHHGITCIPVWPGAIHLTRERAYSRHRRDAVAV